MWSTALHPDHGQDPQPCGWPRPGHGAGLTPRPFCPGSGGDLGNRAVLLRRPALSPMCRVRVASPPRGPGAEPDLARPLLGAAKSPSLRTCCSSTRSIRTSCTSCHPGSGWRSRRRSALLSDRPRRWWRPSRGACCCPRWGTKVAGRGGCTCVLASPPHPPEAPQASPSPRAPYPPPGLPIPYSPCNPHCSAHTLWEVGQLSKQSCCLGRPQGSFWDPEPLLASHRTGDQGQAELQRYVAVPGWRSPSLGGGWAGGQPPLLPPEMQSPRRPAKLLQVMRLHQALSTTASQQQGTLPSVPSRVESKR